MQDQDRRSYFENSRPSEEDRDFITSHRGSEAEDFYDDENGSQEQRGDQPMTLAEELM